jgi:hypothetical protein
MRIRAGVAARTRPEQDHAFDAVAIEILERSTQALQDRIVNDGRHGEGSISFGAANLAMPVVQIRAIGAAHHSTENTFITSSPRWLMTLMAMRPDLGLGKGRDMELRRCSQRTRDGLWQAIGRTLERRQPQRCRNLFNNARLCKLIGNRSVGHNGWYSYLNRP